MRKGLLNEKIREIRKEYKFEYENTVSSIKDIPVSNNPTLLKKLENNRQVIANSSINCTSVYK